MIPMSKALAKYTAKLSLQEGLNVLSTFRSHKIDIDEPKNLGGTDKGPSPIELLLAALGSCQIITLAFFAPRLGVKLKAVETVVEGYLDPRGFMGVSGVRPGFQKICISTKIQAEGPSEKIKELVRISEERCPVNDNIRNNTSIELLVET